MVAIDVNLRDLRDVSEAINNYCNAQDSHMSGANQIVANMLSSDWRGADAQTFATQWSGVNADGSIAVRCRESLRNYSAALVSSANMYQAARADVVNATRALIQNTSVNMNSNLPLSRMPNPTPVPTPNPVPTTTQSIPNGMAPYADYVSRVMAVIAQMPGDGRIPVDSAQLKAFRRATKFLAIAEGLYYIGNGIVINTNNGEPFAVILGDIATDVAFLVAKYYASKVGGMAGAWIGAKAIGKHGVWGGKKGVAIAGIVGGVAGYFGASWAINYTRRMFDDEYKNFTLDCFNDIISNPCGNLPTPTSVPMPPPLELRQNVPTDISRQQAPTSAPMPSPIPPNKINTVAISRRE